MTHKTSSFSQRAARSAVLSRNPRRNRSLGAAFKFVPSTAGTEKRFKVLLVDDDLSVLRGLSAALQFDVDVETCSSGERALSLLREREFDVVCSDYSMPGMDGLELFQRVSKLPVPVACLLLTGAMQFVDRNTVDHYVLTKPVDPGQLAGALVQLARTTSVRRSAASRS